MNKIKSETNRGFESNNAERRLIKLKGLLVDVVGA
jgi:hypothetical protein